MSARPQQLLRGSAEGSALYSGFRECLRLAGVEMRGLEDRGIMVYGGNGTPPGCELQWCWETDTLSRTSQFKLARDGLPVALTI